jgi:GR25 family glycosyltransferase involved in LPS biosynthesis
MAEGRGKTRRKGGTDLFKIPAYVINMKERSDRWNRFNEQPVISKFRKLRRIYGVNGKKLNYLTDKHISMQTKLNIFRNYRRSHYEIATLGAIGASMSHISIWKKFVASGAQTCIVFEDDAVITEDQVNKINELTSSLPSNWGIWILGFYAPNLVTGPASQKPWNRVYSFTAAHAYLLRREAAIKLLQEPFPIQTHIEYYMTGSSIIKDFSIVQHPDVHIEFFRRVAKPRTQDSNTSQHKKNGCPTCEVSDDLSQMYRGYSRKGKNGITVNGLVNGQQSNIIRKLRRRTRRVPRNTSAAKRLMPLSAE